MYRQPPIWASQNYLTSSAYINKLINRAGLKPTDTVLEIGAGKGHITRELIKVCGSVTAIELDPALFRTLTDKFSTQPNLTLVRGDFLKYRLPSHGAYKVFANIPFALTSDIVKKLCTVPNPPREAYLVVERGAAFRLQSTNRAEIVYYISRDEFHPRPRCDAALIKLIK